MDGDTAVWEPPAKRRRLSVQEPERIPDPVPEGENDVAKETRSGITAFVSPNLPGFSGVLKQRYTDFLVNEVLPDGEVLHLQSIGAPKQLRDEARRGLNRDMQNEIPHPEKDLEKVSQENGDCGDISEDNAKISTANLTVLNDLLGESVSSKIVSLYEEVLKHPSRKAKDFITIKSNVIGSKDQRTQVHTAVRKIFRSRLDTSTADDDTIDVSVALPSPQGHGSRNSNGKSAPRGNLSWDELGGSYLHFTLYKENKDTMEVIGYLGSQLKIQPKSFQFGGTKDRRAVTVQRCSVHRVRAADLASQNRTLRNCKIGDFAHSPHGLELGELAGNEFVITLRDCHFPGEDGLDIGQRVELAQKLLSQSVSAFQDGGFLNYYGLQRFGSFATSTDTVGLKLLQGNLEGAISDILSFNPASLATAGETDDPAKKISRDDLARADAINIWLTTHNSKQALERLPRKFSAERNIIQHLGSRNRGTKEFSNLNDFQGALSTIPRNLRLMYVHAYQSLVWNVIAGKRWELYGHQVVEGDLVIVSEHIDKDPNAAGPPPTHDEQGEPIVQPAFDDRATRPEDDFDRARSLTAEEASSGKYSVFDVVLPLPGYDVVYPPNAVGEEYKTFMASERGGGLDPYNMRRSWKDISLSGGYRKVLARPGEGMSFEVKLYDKAEDQLVKTDLERLMENQAQSDATRGADGYTNGDGSVTETAAVLEEAGEKKLAVILQMKLGPSQYATMALRELMKAGGVQTYKPDFAGGR